VRGREGEGRGRKEENEPRSKGVELWQHGNVSIAPDMEGRSPAGEINRKAAISKDVATDKHIVWFPQ
jgi:hypothetical protein